MIEGIRFQEVSYQYAASLPVLNQVSLHLAENQIVVLLGANGSGKSTFLKLCLGYLTPDNGQIIVRGKSSREHDPNWIGKHFAYSPQSSTFPYHLTVEEYILLGRTPHLRRLKSPSPADMSLAGKIQEQLHIEHLSDRVLQELSGGEKQLASFGRILAQETPFVLMDEITAELDIRNTLNLIQVLSELKYSRTILISTHDPQIADSIADTLILFKRGQPLLVGNPEELLTADNLANMYDIDPGVIQESPLQILWRNKSA